MEYKFILEVARHGARAPSVLYDYTTPDQANFAAPMELSDLGARQHYMTGQYVRDEYFAGGRKLWDNMKDSRVYVQSTDKNRTKQSATSQMQGLWDKPLSFPDLDLNNFPLAVNIDENRLLLTDGKNCHRFE